MSLFKGRAKKEEVVGRIELLGEQIRKQRQELAEKDGLSLAEIANPGSAMHPSSWNEGGSPPR